MKPETAHKIVSYIDSCKFPKTTKGMAQLLPLIPIAVATHWMPKEVLGIVFVVVSWGLGISLWHNLRFYSELPLPEKKQKRQSLSEILEDCNPPRLPDLDDHP